MDSPGAILYVVTNKVNGKCYVGLTSRTLRQRKSEHCARVKEGSPYALHRAIRKYGEGSFVWVAVASCRTFEDACRAEQALITQLNPEYNMTAGGEGVRMKRTGVALKKARANMSKVSTLRWVDPSAGERQSLALKASWADPETRERRVTGIRARQCGKPMPEETKAKLIAANTGRKASDETRAKLRAAKKGKDASQQRQEDVRGAALEAAPRLDTEKSKQSLADL